MESDLRPQRPELVFKELIAAIINRGRWVIDCLEAKVYYCVLEIPGSPLDEGCIHPLEAVGFAGC